MSYLINILILLCPFSKKKNGHFIPTIWNYFPYFHSTITKEISTKVRNPHQQLFFPKSISEYVICRLQIREKQLLLREWTDTAHGIASMNQRHSGKTQIKSKFDGMLIRLGAGVALCLLSMKKTKCSFWTETVALLETVHLIGFLLFSCLQNGLKTLLTWNKTSRLYFQISQWKLVYSKSKKYTILKHHIISIFTHSS